MQLDWFQEDVLTFLDNAEGRAIYADDMGGRKTGTTATWLERHPECRRILIVAPKAVHVDHWIKELRRYAPSIVPWRGRGSKASRLRDIDTVAHASFVSVAWVTTYDSMKGDEKELIAGRFDTVVFDEGHRLKGRTTQVAKCSNAITKGVPRVLVVTGTPVMNKPEELWQYLHLLDRKRYSSFWGWVEEHFIVTMKTFKGQRFPTRIIGDYRPGHEDLVRSELVGIIIQRDIKEMFPGEPWAEEPTHIAMSVELTPKERKLYDSIVKHSWGVAETGKPITAANALAVSVRLRQLCSDWGTLDENLETGSKLTAACDDILEWGRDGVPIIVFTSFVTPAHRLVALLNKGGLRARAFTGAETDDQKALALRDYADGKVDVIVGTIASLAEGTDGLQYRSNHIAMVDRDWTYGINEQCIGRLRRSGQKDRVEVRHYYQEGTVDVHVAAANLNKLNVVNTLRGRELHDVIYGRSTRVDEIVLVDD